MAAALARMNVFTHPLVSRAPLASFATFFQENPAIGFADSGSGTSLAKHD